MVFSRLSLAAVFSVLIVVPAKAQPTLPPALQPRAQEPAPLINPEAQKLVEDMVARYKELKSYSDYTEVKWEDATGKQTRLEDGLNFGAVLTWKRPETIRFEGTRKNGSFLAIGDDKNLFVLSPDHPGYYLSRLRHPPLIMTAADGTTTELPQPINNFRLDEPLMELPVGGPGLGFITDPNFWQRTGKDVRVLSLAPDAKVEGEDCRVVSVQLAFDDGGTSTAKLFIAKKDGLLRRMEQSDPRMGANVRIAETHSKVETNLDYAPGTWDFKAPTGAKPIDYFFKLDPHQHDPALKVGDLLPTFSGDDLKGEPLELNSKSGKATVVHFFTMSSGGFDTQILKKMENTIGRDKLQIVAVSGDGARGRVEKFAERYQLPFPVYFDETGMRNPLAQAFGVKGWATTFVFDTAGKLKIITSRPSTAEFQKSIQQLLPDTPGDAFIIQDNEMIAMQ